MSEYTKNKITRREFMKQTSGTVATVTMAGFSSACTASKPGGAQYDILIKGGLVYDGSLMPPAQKDIGIKGNKIVA
ncbi:MAG: twin-arginine translocation signal domain-containing protein, partial [archaeon]|nr:twin-arginine translocation signal domain-containing protein [archaeon]